MLLKIRLSVVRFRPWPPDLAVVRECLAAGVRTLTDWEDKPPSIISYRFSGGMSLMRAIWPMSPSTEYFMCTRSDEGGFV
jgi:hypothetical protein